MDGRSGTAFSPTLHSVEDAQRDVERSLARVPGIMEPHIAVFAQIAELQRRMTSVLAPALASIAHLQDAIHTATEGYRRSQAMMAELTANPFSSQELWVISPVHHDVEVLRPRAVDLPENARWEDIELRMKDPHTLAVFHKDKRIKDCDYGDLGFARANTRDRKPDKQWGLLLKFSIIAENRGVMNPTTEELSRDLQITKGALQKIKESLAKKLSSALGIHSDPFERYDIDKGYRLRFKLKPESILRGDGEVYASGQQYVDEITSEDEGAERW